MSQYGEDAYRPDFSVCLVSDKYKPDQCGPRGPVALSKYHQRKKERQVVETKQLLRRGEETVFAMTRLPDLMSVKVAAQGEEITQAGEESVGCEVGEKNHQEQQLQVEVIIEAQTAAEAN